MSIADTGRKIVVRILFPILSFAGKLLPSFRDKIEKKIIALNNDILPKEEFHTALLLLPHCLQFDECPHKITSNILNCESCGKCDIAEIVKISEKRGVRTKVATGGRLAKRWVKESGADLIIAVACERELVEGIIGAYPAKILGIVNQRPNGPCVNTRVDVNWLSNIMEKFFGSAKFNR